MNFKNDGQSTFYINKNEALEIIHELSRQLTSTSRNVKTFVSEYDILNDDKGRVVGHLT